MGCKNCQNQCLYPMNPKYFKEDTVCEILTIADEMPNIGNILEIIVDPVITKVDIIDTMEGKSHEGQYLTGYKVIVEINFREKILYVSDTPCQTVQGAHFEILKNFFIIVPKEVDGVDFCTLYEENRIKIDPYVEKIHGQVANCRMIQKCLLVFINVVVK